MDYLHALLLLIIVGLLWVIWKMYLHHEADEQEIALIKKEKDEFEELGNGLAEYNQKVQEKKDVAKAKILDILKSGQMANRDIAKNLAISKSTVKRYLDELEASGKVKQVGKTGKWVVYSLK